MGTYVSLSVDERSHLYESILQDSHLDLKYGAMLVFSGLIALFGLLQNSTAVIIGAMLISPLMNPILSAALALLLGDGNLGRESAKVLGLSIGGVILITWLIARLSPLREVTPEILARTNPNLLDLFIALLSGLAGTLALRAGSSSMTIIPGVAIAVAVVPPLAVAGYGLSTRQWAMAGGAFLLFMTNLIAIILSAAAVFRLFGFRAHEQTEKGHLKLKYRLGISFLILLLLSVPLLQTLRKAVTQIQTRKEIARVLNRAFKTEHSALLDTDHLWSRGKLRVHTTLRTTQFFDTAAIQTAEDNLRERFGPETRLDVDQILVAQGRLTPQQAARMGNVLTGGVVRPVPGAEEAPFDLKASELKLIGHLEKQLDDVLKGTPIRRIAPLRAEIGIDPPIAFNLRLASPEPIEKQTLALLSAQLAGKTVSPAILRGEAELEGADYQLTLAWSDDQARLTAKDRQAIAGLLAFVRRNPGFRLRMIVASSQPSPQPLPDTKLWREIQALASGSRLQSSQWSMEAIPPAPAAAESLQTAKEIRAAAPTVQCEFRIVQIL